MAHRAKCKTRRTHKKTPKRTRGGTQEEPTSWWYIPPATDTPENEQQDKEKLDLTESETEHDEWFTPTEKITHETDDGRASRLAQGRIQRDSPHLEGKPSGIYQGTEKDVLITEKEYNPWARPHTTNHCECIPRVRKTDANRDWGDCQAYLQHLKKKKNAGTRTTGHHAQSRNGPTAISI